MLLFMQNKVYCLSWHVQLYLSPVDTMYVAKQCINW